MKNKYTDYQSTRNLDIVVMPADYSSNHMQVFAAGVEFLAPIHEIASLRENRQGEWYVLFGFHAMMKLRGVRDCHRTFTYSAAVNFVHEKWLSVRSMEVSK